jgi:hypothetical protein
MNTARGHMIATSVGGTATGKGGDFIVADDLQNPEMSESKAEREQVIRFFDETLSTRLDDGTDAMLITNKLEDPNTGQDREQSSTKSRKSGG